MCDESKGNSKYYLYILKIDKCRLYIGITDDIERRLSEHKQSKGAKFTKRHTEKALMIGILIQSL